MSGPEVSIPAFLPFYVHLAPRSDVESALRDAVAPVAAPGAVDGLLDDAWHGLVAAVEGQSFRTLIGEFHAFREKRGLPMTAGGDEALTLFREHLGDAANCREITGRYPVLKQRVTTILHNSLSAYGDIFAAYAEDEAQLKAAGLVPSPEPGGLKKIVFTGSDPHNENRQVVHVRLAGGTRLVFKPRALVSDRFVKDLYAAADPYLKHSLRECIPVSVTSESHGWQQFVESKAMESPDQPARYFYRFGALCAVLGSIGASDLHDENLLACGENPCVIDTETMTRADAGVENDSLPHVIMNHMKLSVVSTMLVPMVDPTSPIDINMAGVGVAGDQKSKNLTRPVVRDNTTDNISVKWEPVTYKHHGNVSRLGDRRLSATEYFAETLEGYFDALEFVRGDGIVKILDAYPEMSVRSLLRSTMVYSRFLDAFTHPRYLGEPAEAARLLGLLKNMPEYLSPEAAEFAREEERSALFSGNVPYFVTRSDSTELATHRSSFPGVYKKAPVETARRGVEQNAARTDLYHQFLLEECFGEAVAEDDLAGLSSESVFGQHSLTRARAGSWWPEIARKIDAVSVPFEGPDGRETGWLCGIGPERNAPTMTAGNFVSFHDSGGIVTFLERAARHGKDAEDACRSAGRGLRSLLARYGESLMQTPESVFTGAASMLLARPYGVEADWLGQIFEKLEERAESDELEKDLANGPAGMLMALLSRVELSRVELSGTESSRAEPSRAESSRGESGGGAICGEDRLARLRELTLAHLAAPRTAEWFDVAHGELGLRWALSRAGRVLGDDRLVDESAEWLLARWEFADESPYAGWCNGAAGLLLASAEILTAAGRQERLRGARLGELVDKATKIAPERPLDLSVCHGSSGVVQSLVAAAGILGDGSLVSRAQDYQERVLDTARAHGFYTGAPGRTSLLGYMFGWSGIGDTDALLQLAVDAAGTGSQDFHIPVALRCGVPE
jgi:type 2 lantibiotic biosynthesis protein LanM